MYIVKHVGKMCLKLLLIWNAMDEKERKTSLLVDWSLRVVSKLFVFELTQVKWLQKSIEKHHFLISHFVAGGYPKAKMRRTTTFCVRSSKSSILDSSTW